MDPLELAIFAAETKLLMIGLASLAGIFFAAALLFAFFFGTVNPRLRRMLRRNKRLRDENDALGRENCRLQAELAAGAERIAALARASAAYEKEVQRLDAIRKRTDGSLVETKALLDRLQTMTAHIDMP